MRPLEPPHTRSNRMAPTLAFDRVAGFILQLVAHQIVLAAWRLSHCTAEMSEDELVLFDDEDAADGRSVASGPAADLLWTAGAPEYRTWAGDTVSGAHGGIPTCTPCTSDPVETPHRDGRVSCPVLSSTVVRPNR